MPSDSDFSLLPTCRQVARRKQAAREEALRAGLTDVQLPQPPAAGLTTTGSAEAYLRATAPEIVQRISEGTWTASEVLEAYIARAMLAQQSTNCLTEGPFRGFEGIRSVTGPMGRSVQDLELAARVVFGKQGTDHDHAPLPYRDVVLPDKLRFGYSVSDGFVKASPASQRAVRETVAALRQAGHECVPFDVPQVTDAIECYVRLTASDAFKTLTQDLGADPVEPGISAILWVPSLPGWLRAILAWAVRRVFGDSTLARVILAAQPCSVREYTQWIRRRDDYRRLFAAEVWDKHGFDGLITPVLALPAVPHDSCRYLAPLAGSTCLYNVLNAPVGVLPVTRVRTSDAATVEWTDPRVGRGHGSALVERLLYGCLGRDGRGAGGWYDPEKMAGIPVGVQVVGRKWEEERVVEIMKVVDHALGPRDFGPFCWHEQENA